MPRASGQSNMDPQNEYTSALEDVGARQSPSPWDGSIQRVVVRRNQRISSISLKDVDWISSARNYVELHRRGELFRSRSTLAKLAAAVPARQFLRINRTTIVNLCSVASAHISTSGTIRIRISDGTDLTVSRRYTARVRAVLEELVKPQ